MKQLYDVEGKPLLRQELPELADRATFEGLCEFTRYNDVLEIKGTCFHCGSKCVQILRIGRPELLTPDDEPQVRKIASDCLRRNHACPMMHDGKDTVDDFIKRVGGRV